jgi:hypothetical protein
VNDPNHLEYLQRLLDDPLRVARAAARSGTRVVAYVGDDIPVALIAAADALPVRLRALPRADASRADEFLESAHSPELRSIVAQWLAGAFDFLDAVVFPRTDDSAQRAYYYLCELQRRGRCRGPRPVLYDVANLPRQTSRDHTLDSTRRLAHELGVQDALLPAALERVARRAALLADVHARRSADAPLPGSAAWRVAHASPCDWSEGFESALAGFLAHAQVLRGARRIVLAGNVTPDDSLQLAVEAAGGSVVAELIDSTAVVPASGAADIDAVAAHFQARRSPVVAMRHDGDWIANGARAARAAGVVLWLIEEDEALPWEIARQVRSLREAQVPTLLLTRQCWPPDATALRAVREFVGQLEGAA